MECLTLSFENLLKYGRCDQNISNLISLIASYSRKSLYNPIRPKHFSFPSYEHIQEFIKLNKHLDKPVNRPRPSYVAPEQKERTRYLIDICSYTNLDHGINTYNIVKDFQGTKEEYILLVQQEAIIKEAYSSSRKDMLQYTDDLEINRHGLHIGGNTYRMSEYIPGKCNNSMGALKDLELRHILFDLREMYDKKKSICTYSIRQTSEGFVLTCRVNDSRGREGQIYFTRL